jgi:PPM family protein phosphatase
VIEKTVRCGIDTNTFGIYLIADGLGGHPGGEVASKTAMSTISRYLQEELISDPNSYSASEILVQAIREAHHQILEIGHRKPEFEYMGTTVTVGFRINHDLFLGHVGDCRAYLARNQNLRRLTEDHSVVASLIKNGAISEKEAVFHPDRGRILRSLGISTNLLIDTLIKDTGETKLILFPKDVLCFASDGLTSNISDQDILSCLTKNRDPEQACLKLIQMANQAGGTDNISVIVVRVDK